MSSLLALLEKRLQLLPVNPGVVIVSGGGGGGVSEGIEPGISSK